MNGSAQVLTVPEAPRATPAATPPRASAADLRAGRSWPVWLPLLALIAVTWLARSSDLDLRVSRWFYDANAQLWTWKRAPLCVLLYRWGNHPAFALGSAGALLIAAGLTRRRRQWLRPGAFLLAVLLIGPGLVVNVGLKQCCGRARPHEVRQFGGPHRFTPVWSPGVVDRHNASFPSGHAAMAFSLIAPAFVVMGRRPLVGRALFWGGVAYGTAMSAVRVMQGGHFLTDVVWSAAIVYYTAVGCAWLILPPAEADAAA